MYNWNVASSVSAHADADADAAYGYGSSHLLKQSEPSAMSAAAAAAAAGAGAEPAWRGVRLACPADWTGYHMAVYWKSPMDGSQDYSRWLAYWSRSGASSL